MPISIQDALAATCRRRRSELDLTQAAVASAIGISRSHYAAVEAAAANPSIALVDRIGSVLGVRFDLAATSTIVLLERPVRDALHARCIAYVARRLAAAGWLVRREVLIEDGRLRGWIDLLAFDPSTGRLLVIEVKTLLDDIGRTERQIGWYERVVRRVLPADWHVRSVSAWLLVLASGEHDEAIRSNRAALAQAFPLRAAAMRSALVTDHDIDDGVQPRGLALIDPRSRRRDWLQPSRLDGRRSPPPYPTRAVAMRLLGLSAPAGGALA